MAGGADIFVIDVNAYEITQSALVIIEVLAQLWMLPGKIVQGGTDGLTADGHLGLVAGKLAQGSRYRDLDWHTVFLRGYSERNWSLVSVVDYQRISTGSWSNWLRSSRNRQEQVSTARPLATETIR